MRNWYIGTMGFSYQDWEGSFYPDGLPARSYLAYYSRIFNAGEIDSTFYGIPKLEGVQRWKSSTPEGFRFCLKTPKAISHALEAPEAPAMMVEFIHAVQGLGEKLGVVLLQFPPSFKFESIKTLAGFLEELPTGPRYAVEFRQRSWYTQAGQTAALLRQHGIAWAATEYPGLPGEIQRTADFLYIRWIGQHGSFERHDRERLERGENLHDWLTRLRPELETTGAAYGFFNNDYSGHAPRTALRFMEMLGLDTPPPGLTQGRLL